MRRWDDDQARRLALLLRIFLGGAGGLGAVLLVLATRAAIIQISIGTTQSTASGIDTSLSGADRHGPALVVIAAFALVMLAAALRGARPAMVALAIAGIVVLGIAIVSDARHIDDIGDVRQLYTGAVSGTGSGFYYETLGGALLLVCGGGLLVLSGAGSSPSLTFPPRGAGERVPRRPHPDGESRRTAADDPAAPSGPSQRPPRPAEDWFSDG